MPSVFDVFPNLKKYDDSLLQGDISTDASSSLEAPPPPSGFAKAFPALSQKLRRIEVDNQLEQESNQTRWSKFFQESPDKLAADQTAPPALRLNAAMKDAMAKDKLRAEQWKNGGEQAWREQAGPRLPGTPTPETYAGGTDPAYFARKMPFLGKMLDTVDTNQMAEIDKRIANGTASTDDYYRKADVQMLQGKRAEWGFAGNVGDALLNTAAIAGEFAATGGLTAPETAAAEIPLAARSLASLGKEAIKQGGIQTVVNAPGVVDRTASRLAPELQFNENGDAVLQEGAGLPEAFVRGVLDEFSQNTVEAGGGLVVGKALSKVGSGVVSALPKAFTSKVAGSYKAVKGLLPDASNSQVAKIISKATESMSRGTEKLRKVTGGAIGGVPEEWGEERLGELAGGLLGTPGQDDYGTTAKVATGVPEAYAAYQALQANPDSEQHKAAYGEAVGKLQQAGLDQLAELAVISVFRVPSMVTGAVAPPTFGEQRDKVRLGRDKGVDTLINGTNYVQDWVAKSPDQATTLAATDTPSRSQWEAAGLPKGVSGTQRKAFADAVRQNLASPEQVARESNVTGQDAATDVPETDFGNIPQGVATEQVAQAPSEAATVDPATTGQVPATSEQVAEPAKTNYQRQKMLPNEPPLAEGMIRLYHGSAQHGRYDGPAWFSTDREYAANYRKDAELQYVDVPADKINAEADPDGIGQTVEKGFTVNKEYDSSETGPRKPLLPKPEATTPDVQLGPVQAATKPVEQQENLSEKPTRFSDKPTLGKRLTDTEIAAIREQEQRDALTARKNDPEPAASDLVPPAKPPTTLGKKRPTISGDVKRDVASKGKTTLGKKALTPEPAQDTMQAKEGGDMETEFMVPNVVGEMFGALGRSVSDIRSEISDVRDAGIEGGQEYIEFTFRGDTYRAPLKGKNRDRLIGHGEESDKSIALHALLEKHATKKGGDMESVAKDMVRFIADTSNKNAQKKDSKLRQQFGDEAFDLAKSRGWINMTPQPSASKRDVYTTAAGRDAVKGDETPKADSRVEYIRNEAKAIGEMTTELKRRGMIFQYEYKVNAAKFLGLPNEHFADYSHADWSSVREAIEDFRKEAEDAYYKDDDNTGDSTKTMGEIWDAYAQQHPEKVESIRNEVDNSVPDWNDLQSWLVETHPDVAAAVRYAQPTTQYRVGLKQWEADGRPEIDTEPAPYHEEPRPSGARKATAAGAARQEAARQMLQDAISNPDLVGKQRADTVANLKELVAFYQANAGSDKPLDTAMRNGDEIAYTGVVTDDGFREFIYLDGAKAGAYGQAMTEVEKESSAKARQDNERELQEGFSRLHAKAKEPDAQTEDANLNRSWNSPEGRKTVVGVRKYKDGDRYEVAVGDNPESRFGNELYAPADIDNAVAMDEKRYENALADAPRREAAIKAEQAAQQREAEAAAKKSDLKGFTDDMTPMGKGRAEKILDKNVRSNGKIITTRELIERLVAEGGTVAEATYNDSKGRSQTERRLSTPDGFFRDEKALTKTGMDYAEFLIGKASPITQARTEADAAPATTTVDKIDDQLMSFVSKGLSRGKPVDRAAVARVFPQSKITTIPNGYRVEIGNSYLDIVRVPAVRVNWDAIEQRIGRSIPQSMRDQLAAAGAYMTIDRNGVKHSGLGIIELDANMGDDVALRHEALHLAREAGLFSEKEWQALVDKYGKEGNTDLQNEEAIAQSREAWEGEPSTWEKIKSFFRRILAAMGIKPTQARDVQMLMDEAGFWQRSTKMRGDAVDKNMVAYHGSPHDHNKFTTEKMGTGEGAQAYGWGMYFAGSRDVADYYKKTLGKLTINGQPLPNTLAAQLLSEEDGNVKRAMINARAVISDTEAEIARLPPKPAGVADEFWIDDPAIYQPRLDRHREALAQLEEWSKADIQKKGHGYVVDLKPAEDEYLLWDKPLSEQSEKVKAAMKNVSPGDTPSGVRSEILSALRQPVTKKATWGDIETAWENSRDTFSGNPGSADLVDEFLGFMDSDNRRSRKDPAHALTENYSESEVSRIIQSLNDIKEGLGDSIYGPLTGEFAYKKLSNSRNSVNSDRWASEFLKSLGIRGIKYLDGSSRSAGDGTYNYVIFDDADVEIKEKYQLRARPDLANPATNKEARDVVDTVDQKRNDAGEPVARQEEEFQQKADKLLADDYEGTKAKIIAKGNAMEALNEEETIAAKAIVSRIGQEAVRSGDKQKMKEAEEFINAYRRTGSAISMAFYLRYDPVESPAERYARLITEAILQPPQRDQKRREKALKDGDTKLADKITDEWFDKYTALKDHLKRLGIDIDNLNEGGYDAVKSSKADRAIAEWKADAWDKVYEFRRNSMLSGLTTQVANTLGNYTHGIWHFTGERMAELFVNAGLQRPEGAQIGELPHIAAGIMPGIVNGWRNAMLSYTMELPIFEKKTGAKDYEFETPHTAITGPKGRVIRTPQRFMLAADQFAKTMFAEMEVGAQAYRVAKAEGLTGKALTDRMVELQADTKSKAWTNTIETVENIAFTQKGSHIAQTAKKHVLGVRRAIRIAELFVPFVTFPINALETGLRKTPLGTLNVMRRMYGNYRDGKNVFDGLSSRIAEQFVAWSVMAMLAYMNDDDDPWITGAEDATDRKTRDMAYRSNRPPMSVKLGGKWHSYGRFEPFATTLGMMVDWSNAAKSGDTRRMVKSPFKSLAGQVGEKTFLAGTADLIEAFTDSDSVDEKAAKIGSDITTSFIPNIVKQASASDREQIPERGVWGKGSEWATRFGKRTIQKTELGIYGDQKKYDLWGREIDTSRSPVPFTDWAYRMSIPVRNSSTDVSKADNFLLAWNKDNPEEAYYPFGAPKYYKDGGKTVYYTDEEYAAFAKVAGGTAMNLTNKLDLDPVNPTKEQLDSIKDAISTARSVARDALAKNPNATVEDATRLAMLDITTSRARTILANEPKSVTDREKSEGITLGAKKTRITSDAQDAKNWIKDSGLDKSEVEGAVWEWIKGDLSTKEGQLDKMRRFQKSMGWSQWERWRKSP